MAPGRSNPGPPRRTHRAGKWKPASCCEEILCGRHPRWDGDEATFWGYSPTHPTRRRVMNEKRRAVCCLPSM